MLDLAHKITALIGPAWLYIGGTAGAVALLSTIANLFRDPDHNPETPPPPWVQVADLLALVATRGNVGVFNTRLSIPGVRSKKPRAPRPPKLPLALALISFGLSLTGCAAALDGAMQARNEIGTRVTEAAKAWEKYDAQRIEDIKRTTPKTREDQEKAILDYANGEHLEAVKVFNTAWSAVVGLDRAIAAFKAGANKDLPTAIANAWAALSEIAKALTKLGIKIPGVL